MIDLVIILINMDLQRSTNTYNLEKVIQQRDAVFMHKIELNVQVYIICCGDVNFLTKNNFILIPHFLKAGIMELCTIFPSPTQASNQLSKYELLEASGSFLKYFVCLSVRIASKF